ncbi:MAG: type II toxin-antitoxin system YafQ family toxin [Magnetococcales bacterium]|nr:type II toxin-antitoxin system YafQ family toxin [Magnetococcales bacterium]
MRKLIRSSQFKRDIKKAIKQGRDMEKLKTLLSLLIDGKTLPPEYLDHSLKGNWKGYRDAHIEPDWLLIYQVDSKCLKLVRTGSHSELF